MPELTLEELAADAGLEPRRIRFLIAKGLLEGADRRGPKARYPAQNLARLALIERYKDRMTLDEIRQLFQEIGENGIRQLVGESSAPQEGFAMACSYPSRPDLGSASDYVSRFASLRAAPPPRQEDRPWHRLALHPDLEIHYRHPSPHAGSELILELLRLAEDLFSDLSDSEES